VILHDPVTLYPGVRIGARTEVFEGAVLGHPPSAARPIARPIGTRHGATTIAADCVISPHVVLYMNVHIGRGCLIGDSSSIREGSRIGDECLIGRNVTINYNAQVGSRTRIMDGTHLTGNIRIGSDVFLGPLVITVNDDQMGARGYSRQAIRGPRVDDKARVGAGAILFPGITVGRNAVIGAGSVVTHSVPPGKLVMGVPARVVGNAP
jgi:acetyltransferase-like isoleucine patch superfamily enzyme